MGLIAFMKEAGEKLFGRGKAQAAMTEVKAAPADPAKIQAANAAAGDAIHPGSSHLSVHRALLSH